MSERIRSFIAVDVADKEIVQRIVALQRELLRTGADLKPVEPENLHYTLLFLGEQPKRSLDELAKRLESISAPCFQLELRGVGAFPREDSPRVVWIGAGKGREELAALAYKVRELAKDIAQADEEFAPHLTIARVKGPRNKDRVAEFIAGHKNDVFGVVQVCEVKLKKSVLTPRGPIYSDLYVKKLA